MTKDEALKLALEALQVETTPLTKDRQEVLRAITAIKEALAQPTSGDYALGYSIGFGEGHSAGKALAQSKEPEQEPVAWEQFYPDIGKLQLTHPPQGIYYTPPQRTWVELTDDEILAVNMSTVTKLIDEPIVCDTDHNIIKLGKAIEAKLKAKNTRGQE